MSLELPVSALMICDSMAIWLNSLVLSHHGMQDTFNKYLVMSIFLNNPSLTRHDAIWNNIMLELTTNKINLLKVHK